MAAVVLAADQPAERLRQPRADDAIVVSGAAAGEPPRARWRIDGLGHGTCSSTTQRSEWPGTSTPSRRASVPSSGRARVVAEDVDQRAGVDRIDVLGVERQAVAREPVGDAAVHRAQPADRGEQPEHAAVAHASIMRRIGAGERGNVALLARR